MFKKILFMLAAMIFIPAISFASDLPWRPTKTIEIIVPYPPGGSTDKWGRIIAEILTDHGWPAMVVNKPGADTTIASNYVAKARPDGHTLYLSGIGFLDANISFRQKPPGIEYTEKSFTDIVPIGSGTLVLVSNPNIPVKNYEEFKQYVRQNPDKFNVGFFNNYIANLFYSWAKKENLPKPNIIMYKGSTPLGADLIGGHVPFAFDTYNTIAPHHKDNKVQVLAVLDTPGAKIVSGNYPVIGRTHPSLNMSIYYGVSGPAGMDLKVVQQINVAINQGLQKSKYTKPITDMYMGVSGGTPADLTLAHTTLRRLFANVAKEIE